MSKKKLTSQQIKEIVDLRQTGHSLPEIKKITGRSSGSVFKYIKDIKVLEKYKEILRIKQGGSKERANKKWADSKESVSILIGKLSRRDNLIFLAGLYWGEGTKRELNLINGDPYLIKSFINGLYDLGIDKKDVKLNLRVFSTMNEIDTKKYWSEFLEINEDQFGNSEILEGKTVNKLTHGMCRVRVSKSEKHFKLIMSMIDYIKLYSMPL